MKTRDQWIIALVVVAIWPAGSSQGFAAECDLGNIKSGAKLNDMLGRRSVEVVQRAARPDYRTDRRLEELVEPSATFDLGHGDVGRPLGTGVGGASSLADTMHADSFRFRGWNFMDMPVDGCATHKITVEFIDGPEKESSEVVFIFRAGRVVSGKGWGYSFESGPLNVGK